ncbi:MAG: monovalent cation/H+ antiporter complex subunit F [Chloroflexota bacterium]|nr:monovalent cation/H+ antiporter complex subunit F [Chloroflexota bacterium]MDE2858141.1 monovalent cation/H+ antiporter complex subunit F [Chloroflexota bacterium]MDE2949438.1 monovalent cation/H+ antiporter complex subunit F [Chloroflexota bacterium]
MIESEFAQAAIKLVLLALVSLLIPASYRVIVGKTLPDRLQAVDLITTLLIGIIVMLALVEGTQVFVDMAIALAAFAFVGTISIARYISEGRGF